MIDSRRPAGRNLPAIPIVAIFSLLLLSCGGGGGGGDDDARTDVATCDVIAPPRGYDAIYQRYLNCNGIPIVATRGVDDAALELASETMDFLLIGNDAVKTRIANSSHYYILYGDGVGVTGLPGWGGVSPDFGGYSTARATTSSGEELLCQTDKLLDRPEFFEGNNLVHEFAHVIHLVGYGAGSAEDDGIRATYDAARGAGLWDNTYAAQDHIEYFAELSAIWFEVGRKQGPAAGDGTRNHITSRAELQAYDPGGYALMGSHYNARLDPPGCIQRNVITPYLDPDLNCPASVIDGDGNSYPLVRIGNQCWMTDNLHATHFRSGAAIDEVTDNFAWSIRTTPARANYDNDPANVADRGRLYNHAAILSAEGLCPGGLRMPSIDDLERLGFYLDPLDEKAVAPMLSEVGEWANASDDYGFAAQPAGLRRADGGFEGLDAILPDYRWLVWSTDDNPGNAGEGISKSIVDGFDDLVSLNSDKRQGLSVRCLNDDAVVGAGSFSVGGVLTGLLADSVELQLDGGDDIVLAADGAFDFPNPINSGQAYSVGISGQPGGSPSQTCSVANASGIVSGADVDDVVVNCSVDSFPLGATITGLTGEQMSLMVNVSAPDFSVGVGGQTFIDANGFRQLRLVQDLWVYTVTVQTQPINPSQVCTVTNGSGAIAGVEVLDVQVNCL